MQDVAIIIGHTEKSQGALSEHFNQREWSFYNDVVPLLHKVDVYRHNKNIGGYTARIKNTSTKLNKKDYKLIIACHFNSATPQANGCETLYYFNSKKGKYYAEKFTELIVDRFCLKDRGIKALVNKNDRGFAITYYLKAPVILIEPFFGSNDNDCKLIGSSKNLAEAINLFITKYIRL